MLDSLTNAGPYNPMNDPDNPDRLKIPFNYDGPVMISPEDLQNYSWLVDQKMINGQASFIQLLTIWYYPYPAAIQQLALRDILRQGPGSNTRAFSSALTEEIKAATRTVRLIPAELSHFLDSVAFLPHTGSVTLNTFLERHPERFSEIFREASYNFFYHITPVGSERDQLILFLLQHCSEPQGRRLLKYHSVNDPDTVPQQRAAERIRLALPSNRLPLWLANESYDTIMATARQEGAAFWEAPNTDSELELIPQIMALALALNSVEYYALENVATLLRFLELLDQELPPEMVIIPLELLHQLRCYFDSEQLLSNLAQRDLLYNNEQDLFWLEPPTYSYGGLTPRGFLLYLKGVLPEQSAADRIARERLEKLLQHSKASQ